MQVGFFESRPEAQWGVQDVGNKMYEKERKQE
jgi:hypothetical protein